MSLLPKLPCRRLFIDSRFAEGTATDFTVNIPEAGLDLPDNCVAYVDAISVPSIQNVFDGRNRIYYKERAASGAERTLMIEIPPSQYTPSLLTQQIQTGLGNNFNVPADLSGDWHVYFSEGNFNRAEHVTKVTTHQFTYPESGTVTWDVIDF